ncbi:hypothetical protein M413DRAFT_165692 [Hebeloma cylindrosporum]|uniref:Uncharacterized protein n=1 Tax=Hebeloma cylindrosporum TaxID=76867 RepID=A0A0C3CAN8_HEBCY|nr:hypothetical protein M413DRAFT_165692 [Hebeloma cylindrosporum h7]
MATSAATGPSTQSSQLCDYCHQKPKFSNHSFCSKTCAGQAATLCNHCHKKPKFQNFEYCGKNCAALANPGGKSRNAQTGVAGTRVPNPKSNGIQAQQQQGAPQAFDPVKLAKLVAQHIPQVQAMLGQTAAQASAPSSQPVHTNPFSGPTAQVVPPTTYPAAPVNNPFLDPVGQQQQTAYPTAQAAPGGAMTNGAVVTSLGASSKPQGAQQLLHISTQKPADNLECLIPGCGQPVHVDAKGVKVSEYCSMRHREEAVTSGLVAPCIMCLTLPQSENDYFCSRLCREDSMSKPLEYDEEEASE